MSLNRVSKFLLAEELDPRAVERLPAATAADHAMEITGNIFIDSNRRMF